MSIKSGSMTFRMFRRTPTNDGELIKRLAAHALPPINTLGDGCIHGWVTGRHALDRNLTADNAVYGGHLCVGLTVAEKRVPASMLQAECRMQELAQLEATGEQRLSAATRAEIRKSVHDRLQATATPTLRTIELVAIGRDNELVLASCTSDNQQDALQIAWLQACGHAMLPLQITTLCPKLKDGGPVSFSPSRLDEDADCNPAREFLTWLWFLAEAQGGLIKLSTGNWAVMIEGPLLMALEGAGAHETLLRKGEPLLSAEVKAALGYGKKLRRARLTLARGDEIFACTFDADTFTVRGLKLPEGEKLDPVSRFQTRMDQADLFCRALMELVNVYEARRLDGDWRTLRGEIHQWVEKRRTRS